MDKEEEVPLLGSDVDQKHYLTGKEQTQDGHDYVDVEKSSCFNRLRNAITVEPVLFLYFLAYIPTFPLTQQYVRLYFSLKYDLKVEQSLNVTTYDCSSNVSAESFNELEQKVQQETSQYMIYLNTATLLPSCLSALFLGAYTDQAGRKGVLLLPLATGVFRSLFFICIIQFQLDIKYLMIANVINGLSGGSTTVLSSCYAYVADITSEKERSFRMLVLELGIGLGVILSQIYTGHMIETLGFVYPFLLTGALHTVNLLSVLAYIKDSQKAKEGVSLTDFEHLKKTVGLFIKDVATKRRWKLQLLVMIVLLNYMVDTATLDVYTFYTISSPFCFSPVLIGYFNAILYLLRVSGSMTFLKLFEKRLMDTVTMMIGTTSGIAGQLVMALALTKALIFLSPVVGTLTALVVPLARSQCSKLVEPNEQGAMSASLSLAQQVSSLLGSLIFNSIYAHTVSIYSGIVFIVTSSVYGISLLLMIVLFTRRRL